MPHKNLIDNDRIIREEVRRLEDRRVRACSSGKVCYKSMEAADVARKNEYRIWGLALYIYQCRRGRCRAYHLTKLPQ